MDARSVEDLKEVLEDMTRGLSTARMSVKSTLRGSVQIFSSDQSNG